MESPQMYDTPQSISQVDLKKMANNNNGANLNSSNNNSATTINHNALIVNKQQGQLHLQQANNNNNNNTNNNNNNNNNNSTNNSNNGNNAMLQKQILQHYSQSDLEELTSQEISLDLQHLIDDQFREQEALGIFSDLVPNNSNNNNNGNPHANNNNGSVMAAAKVLHLQQNRMGQQPAPYGRSTLAYMPQPVHTGANYTNNSSDENSSVGSDGTNIKEEPVEPVEYRRLAAAAAVAVNSTQFIGANQNQQMVAAGSGGLYQIPPNYASNGSGNTFTTLSGPNLHHQSLPHMPGNHLVNLKHKQMISQRKQLNKHVDKGTDEYRRRRERNNIAVRKSREKAKVRSREVEEKVKALIKEKDGLVRRLEEMTNEIQLHKQLYVHLMNHNNPEVNNICRNVLSLVSSEHGM